MACDASGHKPTTTINPALGSISSISLWTGICGGAWPNEPFEMKVTGNVSLTSNMSCRLYIHQTGGNSEGWVEKPIKCSDGWVPSMEINATIRMPYTIDRITVFDVYLEVEAIVPQHGRAFFGKPVVNEFLDWFANLECGVDLMTQGNYQVPD